MVRYPEDRRVSLGDLEQMRIRAPGGVEVPFSTVAEAELGVITSYSIHYTKLYEFSFATEESTLAVTLMARLRSTRSIVE